MHDATGVARRLFPTWFRPLADRAPSVDGRRKRVAPQERHDVACGEFGHRASGLDRRRPEVGHEHDVVEIEEAGIDAGSCSKTSSPAPAIVPAAQRVDER